MLDEHLKIENLKKESLGISNDLIFTSMAEDFMPKKTIQDWFKRFLVRKDLKIITFHGLHHTSGYYSFS